MKHQNKIIIGATAALLAAGSFALLDRVDAGGIPESEPLIYTGVIEDSGQPVNGMRNLEISLWDTADGTGTPVCSTRADSREVVDGRFQIALNDVCTEAVRLNSNLWVEVRVDGGSLGRSKVGAVPYAVNADNGVPVGTVVPFAGPVSSIPSGWLLCDGAELSRSDFPKLFAAIGGSHGGGDGAATFNLPDFRGRFLRGVDHGAGRDPEAAGRATALDGGNSGDKVGSVQGDALQSHTHLDTGHNHTRNPQGNKEIVWRQTHPNGTHGVPSNNHDRYHLETHTGTSKARLGNPTDSGSGAGNPRHGRETRPKNAYVNYIIKY